MKVDPYYRRIAKRLKVFQLVGDDDAAAGLGLELGDPSRRTADRFLGFYSRDGLRRALEAYGVHDHLDQLGLGAYEIVISADDPFRHRVQALIGGVADDEHRIIDLVIRQVRVKYADLPGQDSSTKTPFDLLLVEWLCLQDPRARFTAERPRLPGQRHPGLGLARVFHNLTLLMAQRLERDGVLNVPEHFYLAVLYHRAGYLFLDRRHELEVCATERAVRKLTQPVAAWAAERGCIRMLALDGQLEPGAEPWTYRPAEMVAPISRRLKARMARPLRLMSQLGCSRPRAEIDLERLRRSLRADPVEGLDADTL